MEKVLTTITDKQISIDFPKSTGLKLRHNYTKYWGIYLDYNNVNMYYNYRDFVFNLVHYRKMLNNM